MDSIEGIEALGGDASFFLDPEEVLPTLFPNDEGVEEKPQTGANSSGDDGGWKLGDGPRPNAPSSGGGDEDGGLWDGNVVEDAYFDD